MSIFVSIGGQLLYTGRTTAEIAAWTTSYLAGLTVAEIRGYENQYVLVDPAPSISMAVEERATAEFSFLDLDGIFAPDYGQEVIISDSVGRLFGGLVEKITQRLLPRGGVIYDISAIDYQALADRRQFFKAYVDTTVEDIIYDILDILGEEGVLLGNVPPGGDLENITFNGISCAESLDKVADLAGRTWWIDEYKKLYVVPRTTYPADWDASDNDILWPPKIELGNPEYRNVQYLKAGSAETSEITQNFRGDGVTQTFVLGYPLAHEPEIRLNGVLQTVGIKGLNLSGYQWYWSKDDNTVVQEFTSTPIDSDDTLAIKYVGSFKLMAKVTAPAEITRQKLSQGFGSGKIENTAIDSSIKSQTAALDSAKARLARYAVVGRKLTYHTLRGGLAVGTMQHIDFLDVDMLIYSIDISFDDGLTTYEIGACEGPVEESWENLFCGIIEQLKAGAAREVGEVEGVIGLTSFSKTWLDTEHPNPFIAVYPGTTPADTDFPCLASGDRLSYLVLYDSEGEFFRRPISVQEDVGNTILTTAIVEAAEANDVQIVFVGLWGGDSCSDTPGSGIEMEKHAFERIKNALESLQFDFEDVKGWS